MVNAAFNGILLFNAWLVLRRVGEVIVEKRDDHGARRGHPRVERN